MQRMIMIPEERYNKMLEGYDEAIEELRRLREELQAVKEGERPGGEDQSIL